MNLPVTSAATPVSLPAAPSSWELKPVLPTMYDLPSEDPEEPGLPDMFHGLQPQLLDETLWLPQYPDDGVFHAFDMNLYYDVHHTGWHKRPDWFLCLGVPFLYKGVANRSSYVMWDEKVIPTLVIEFLSPGTESEDLGRFTSKTGRSRAGKPPAKFVVYEEILKIPNYIVFDADSQQLRFFRLVNDRYQEQPTQQENPRLWIPDLNLGLGIKTGSVRKITGSWLRWCDADGNFYPTPTESERAEKDAALAQIESERAEKDAAIAQAKQQQTQAIENLLSIGLPPEQIALALGVEMAIVQVIVNQ